MPRKYFESSKTSEDMEDNELIKEELLEEDEIPVNRYDVWSNLIQPNVDLIVNYLESGRIKIPNFQRVYRWSIEIASKFIESILLGLPIPPVFLSRNEKNEYLVIDGQQRLLTLFFFYKEKFPKLEREFIPLPIKEERTATKLLERLEREKKIQEFRLKNVKKKWKNKLFSELTVEDKNWLGGFPIWAIVVEQRVPENDDSSLYYLFQRLNTGGELLSPMEIRKVVFYGSFIQSLEEVNQNNYWRKIYGKQNPDIKLMDVEVLLRILALFEEWMSYKKPMKEFLNKYLRKNRNNPKTELLRNFLKACEVIVKVLGDKPFHIGKPKRRNLAFMDSFFVGVLTFLSYHKKKNKNRNLNHVIEILYKKLKEDKKYRDMIKVRNPTETKDLRERIEYVLQTLEKVYKV